ncbi:MAG: PQQ-dependent sugar dehydrogenase [Gammaproteobacteria bacterium]|nr:PQQ-dependent sugar dehydrogenase [Gammaproteobacteria bacterium]MDP2141249.1 PQQ-dependent sugar dehydrogenase [Gammaproteobacteria bacterium]MDP2349077.1 PQQ-dependent sugar dehydrogenase [Gammaproteobacteria bacterium]
MPRFSTARNVILVAFLKSLPGSLLLSLALCAFAAPISAQVFPLGEGPWVFDTYSPPSQIRVSVIARGIEHPWGMAFLPDGDVLIAERKGTLRIIRKGDLDPNPVTGIPEIAFAEWGGLMDVVLHPQFDQNRYVYFTYTKSGEAPEGQDYWTTTALGRGRLNAERTALNDVEELLVTNGWSDVVGGHGSRLRFAPDGKLFMSSPFRRHPEAPQDPMSHIGKLLRLNDDGTPASDNPYIGNDAYQPEIWSMGHRAIEGMDFHPETGELWAAEHGPQGGDEVNIVQPTYNYGWPLVSFGRDYSGRPAAALEKPYAEGMVQPLLVWVPSIAPSGLMFYTGEYFPRWRNDLIVGGLMTGRIPGTGHLERVSFNVFGEIKRERLLEGLKQRIRDVQMGPDGHIYVLTEEVDGALLVIEPVALP